MKMVEPKRHWWPKLKDWLLHTKRLVIENNGSVLVIVADRGAQLTAMKTPYGLVIGKQPGSQVKVYRLGSQKVKVVDHEKAN